MKKLLAMTLAVILAVGVLPVAAFAAEVDDTAAYTVAVREDIAGGTVSVDRETATAGDTVTITVTPDEGYTATQVGYWTVAEDGTEGKVNEITAAAGVYTFTMPESNVEVGAALQNEAPMIASKLNGNKIVNENGESLGWKLYIANAKAYLNVGDTETSVYLSIDKRFFDLEGVQMALEVRQYSDGGYILAGREELDVAALAASADETTDSDYIFNALNIGITNTLRENYNAYCVVQISMPGWIDAKGNEMLLWNYTGTDTIIFAEGVQLPSAMVWLYNLDANSYRGALVRSILADLDIGAGTVDNENLGQRIGYMIEWPGYEAVEDPYSPNEYDVEYMLMANLTEVQLDKLLDSMQENNIRVNLKSLPTVWTASKTFEELFDIMAEEDEVLKAAIALDKMIYTAESLDEAVYGGSEYWDAFQTALADAIVALSTDAEETGEGAALYDNARLALLDAYLKVTGKLLLEGDLALTAEDLGDGTYKLSASLEGMEDAAFTYSWTVGLTEVSTEATATVAAADLYKVKLTITGTGSSYGTLTEQFYIPAAPDYTVTASDDSATVAFAEAEDAFNTPAVSGYVVEVSREGEVIATVESDSAVVTIDGLMPETEYTVTAYVVNIIGRSDMVTKPFATTAAVEEETQAPTEAPSEEPTEAPSQEPEQTPTEAPTEAPTTSVKPDTAPKTGDAGMGLWTTLLMVSGLGLFALVHVARKRNLI